MDIEKPIGKLLQTGVLAAAGAMVAGGALYLARHGAELPNYRSFHAIPQEYTSFRGILGGVSVLNSGAILQLGALLMIATPVVRVAFAAVAFAIEKDWLYTMISTIVLALLAYALY